MEKQLFLNDFSQNLRHIPKTFLTRSTSCRKAYKILLRKQTDPPTSQGRLLKYGINESELSLHVLPFTICTKLSIFQFKILHNILPTNLHLYRMNIRDSSSCPYALIAHKQSNTCSSPVLPQLNFGSSFTNGILLNLL